MDQSLPIKHDEHHSTGSGKCQQARFRKAIRLDLAIFENSHVILILLHVSVENGQV
jgi:hypothetical protein